jgi:hypothetical protein
MAKGVDKQLRDYENAHANRPSPIQYPKRQGVVKNKLDEFNEQGSCVNIIFCVLYGLSLCGGFVGILFAAGTFEKFQDDDMDVY